MSLARIKDSTNPPFTSTNSLTQIKEEMKGCRIIWNFLFGRHEKTATPLTFMTHWPHFMPETRCYIDSTFSSVCARLPRLLLFLLRLIFLFLIFFSLLCVFRLLSSRYVRICTSHSLLFPHDRRSSWPNYNFATSYHQANLAELTEKRDLVFDVRWR